MYTRALLAGARRARFRSPQLQEQLGCHRTSADVVLKRTGRRRFGATPPTASSNTATPIPGAAYESAGARKAALSAFRTADQRERRKYAEAVAKSVAKKSEASMSEKDAAAAAAAAAATANTLAGHRAAAIQGAAIASAMMIGAVGTAAGYSQYRRWQGDTRALSTIVVDDLLGGRGWFIGGAVADILENIEAKMERMRGPSSDKLLMDWMDMGYPSPPLTVIISLERVLISRVWSADYGWRTQIRPNAIDFLLKAYKLGYEIVVFSDQHMLNAVDQVEQLQTLMGLKEGFSLERAKRSKFLTELYREATYMDNTDQTYIKDLSKMNRDLGRIIVVDCDPRCVKLHPENAIIVPSFEPDAAAAAAAEEARQAGKSEEEVARAAAAAKAYASDEVFGEALQHFMREVAMKNIQDVREVLHSMKRYKDMDTVDFRDVERFEARLRRQEMQKNTTLIGMVRGQQAKQARERTEVMLNQRISPEHVPAIPEEEAQGKGGWGLW